MAFWGRWPRRDELADDLSRHLANKRILGHRQLPRNSVGGLYSEGNLCLGRLRLFQGAGIHAFCCCVWVCTALGFVSSVKKEGFIESVGEFRTCFVAKAKKNNV